MVLLIKIKQTYSLYSCKSFGSCSFYTVDPISVFFCVCVTVTVRIFVFNLFIDWCTVLIVVLFASCMFSPFVCVIDDRV
jgi:hypothetical protein